MSGLFRSSISSPLFIFLSELCQTCICLHSLMGQECVDGLGISLDVQCAETYFEAILRPANVSYVNIQSNIFYIGSC